MISKRDNALFIKAQVYKANSAVFKGNSLIFTHIYGIEYIINKIAELCVYHQINISIISKVDKIIVKFL